MARFIYFLAAWSLTAWMLGAMCAFVLGLSGALAPIAALTVAGIVVHRHRALLRAPSVVSAATSAAQVADPTV